jgi:hypothetical protein
MVAVTFEPAAAAADPRRDVRRVVAVTNTVLLLAFLFVLLHRAILNPFLLEPHTAWAIHCYAFAIPVLVVNGVARRRFWRPTPFDYLICVYIGMVLATWPTSANRTATSGAVFGLLAQVAVYCAVRVLADDRPAWGRVIIAALVGGIGLLEWTALDTHARIGLSSRLIDIPPLEWNGREGLGLAAAIQCALLVGIWQQTRSRTAQVAALVLVLGAIVELLFLYSRLAWAATAAALIAGVLCSVRLGGLRRYMAALIVIGAFIWGVGTPYMLSLAKVAAGLESGDLAVGGLSYRLAAWFDAPSVIRMHPLLGTGLGTYMSVRQTIQLPRSRHLPDGLPPTLHPHNAYLQHMGEVGIVGGAAYIALWATALWAGWRITSRAKAGLQINLSLFLALIAIAVANLGENMFEGTERQRLHSIAWMVAALIVAEWNRGRLPHPRIEHAA